MYVHYLVQQSVCTNALLSHVCTFNTVCEEYLNRNRFTVNKCFLKKTGHSDSISFHESHRGPMR